MHGQPHHYRQPHQQSYTVPIYHGTVRAMDLRQIKTGPDDFGLMTYDPAFMNTASCQSAITYLDGDKGILRYRGYPIEQLAEQCSFLEVAYLLLNRRAAHARTSSKTGSGKVMHHTMTHETVKKFMDGFHYDAHPMGILISTVAALSTFYPEPRTSRPEVAATNRSSASSARCPPWRPIAYRHRLGLPYVYPDTEPHLHRELHEHAVEDAPSPSTRPTPSGARARGAVHPARRPRTELQHQRDARGGQFPGRSIRHCRGGIAALFRPAARRRQ